MVIRHPSSKFIASRKARELVGTTESSSARQADHEIITGNVYKPPSTNSPTAWDPTFKVRISFVILNRVDALLMSRCALDTSLRRQWRALVSGALASSRWRAEGRSDRADGTGQNNVLSVELKGLGAWLSEVRPSNPCCGGGAAPRLWCGFLGGGGASRLICQAFQG
jgi:hypothetical protein